MEIQQQQQQRRLRVPAAGQPPARPQHHPAPGGHRSFFGGFPLQPESRRRAAALQAACQPRRTPRTCCCRALGCTGLRTGRTSMQLGLRCEMEMGLSSGNSWFSAQPGNTRPLPWRLHPQVKGEGYPGMLNKGALAAASPACLVPVPSPVLPPAWLLGNIANELVSACRKTENNEQLRPLQIIIFADGGWGMQDPAKFPKALCTLLGTGHPDFSQILEGI